MTGLRSIASSRPWFRIPVFHTAPAPSLVARPLFRTWRTLVSSSILRVDDFSARRPYPEGISPSSRWESVALRKKDPTETLYVGNVPFYAVKSQLEELFGEFGTVESIRMATFPSGESKGFAHVEYKDVASAQKAMAAHEESQFFIDGRVLKVDYAPPMPVASVQPSTSIHFAEFDGDVSSLREALGEFHDVIYNIRIIRNPQTNNSNRYGFIDCATVEDATALLNKYNGKETADGQTLRLSFARGKREAPRFVSYGRNESRDYGDEGRGRGRYDSGRGGGRGSRYPASDGEYRPRQDLRGGRGDMSYRVGEGGPRRTTESDNYGSRQHGSEQD